MRAEREAEREEASKATIDREAFMRSVSEREVGLDAELKAVRRELLTRCIYTHMHAHIHVYRPYICTPIACMHSPMYQLRGA